MLRDTKLAETTTLPGLLRHWAQTQPDRLAFREKDLGVWQRFTYRDYYERTRDFAYGLLALGVEPGDFLAVASENTPEWMFSDMAIQALAHRTDALQDRTARLEAENAELRTRLEALAE